ncbi:DUF6457 domain-containing protein [Trueperella bialowiezensis]|uniref:DUF6457 domain-containing protein n=1 Tax=Trueperella bialowiezensis TaxID=312285 RepID=A0A3S4UXX0_9ACTO|nr:DUF6457 domain-containing protein [Trueperella bialowiezensis]VEI12578.1 Uncharacterised protein [Trueperella bialowiezensis]
MSDEAKKMEIMGKWLDAVADELGLDATQYKANRDELLNLTAKIAHGPSRPGAPMTLFLIGLTSASSGEVSQAVTKIEELIERYEG